MMEGNREKIQTLAEQLRKLSFPSSPISVELAQFAATAFDLYLTGEAKTLDAAFGLTPKRGRPEKCKEHEAIARKIFSLRLNGTPWESEKGKNGVFASLSDCSINDERQLRRIYKKFKVKLMAEEISKTWKDFDGA